MSGDNKDNDKEFEEAKRQFPALDNTIKRGIKLFSIMGVNYSFVKS